MDLYFTMRNSFLTNSAQFGSIVHYKSAYLNKTALQSKRMSDMRVIKGK